MRLIPKRGAREAVNRPSGFAFSLGEESIGPTKTEMSTNKKSRDSAVPRTHER